MGTDTPASDNISKAMTIFEGWNAGNSELTFAWFAEDARYHGAEMVGGLPRRKWYEGKSAIAEYLRKWHTIMVVTYTVSAVVADGDLVVAEWANEGVFPDGSKYHNIGVMMIEFKNGMIHEVRIYYDSRPAQALALVPARAQES
jgi:ketosteroid isomerase-like protein